MKRVQICSEEITKTVRRCQQLGVQNGPRVLAMHKSKTVPAQGDSK